MRVEVKSASDSFVATSTNVGAGGMFVATDRPLRVGERLTVELELPGFLRPMAVEAEVRWVQATDGQSSGVGLRFVRPSLALTVAVHELLRKG